MKISWLTRERITIMALVLVSGVLICFQSVLAQFLQRPNWQDCTALFGRIGDKADDVVLESHLIAEKSVAESERFGKKDTRYSAALANQARLLLNEKNYKEAETLFRQSLAIDEKSLGVDNPALFADLNGLATALVYQKKSKEADHLLDRTIAIGENLYGKDSSRLTAARTLLATVHLQERRLEQARKVLQSVLQTNLRQHGSNSLEVAICLNNISSVDQEQGEEAEAYDGSRRANAIAGKKRFANLPESWAIKDNYRNFEKTLEEKYVFAVTKLAADFPKEAFEKAGVLRKQGKFKEAENILKDSFDTALGAQSRFDRAKYLVRLNNVAFDQGRDPQAILWGTMALKLLDQSDAKAHSVPWKVNALSYLGMSYERQALVLDAPARDYLLSKARTNYEEALAQSAQTDRHEVSDRWINLIKLSLAQVSKDSKVPSRQNESTVKKAAIVDSTHG